MIKNNLVHKWDYNLMRYIAYGYSPFSYVFYLSRFERKTLFPNQIYIIMWLD